jgi:hypothetical protein
MKSYLAKKGLAVTKCKKRRFEGGKRAVKGASRFLMDSLAVGKGELVAQLQYFGVNFFLYFG